MTTSDTPAAPWNTEEQLLRPIDRLAMHLYDALQNILAARKVLNESGFSYSHADVAAVTLCEAWHTISSRLEETADYGPNASAQTLSEAK